MLSMWSSANKQTRVIELWIRFTEIQITTRSRLEHFGSMDIERNQTGEFFADIPEYKSPSAIFISRRPDIVVKLANRIETLELTVCHETNVISSKQYKTDKYALLRQDLIADYKHCELNNHSIEVTTFGFISDCSSFTCNIGIKLMPNSIKSALFRSVISDSYAIYCSRNSPLFT